MLLITLAPLLNKRCKNPHKINLTLDTNGGERNKLAVLNYKHTVLKIKICIIVLTNEVIIMLHVSKKKGGLIISFSHFRKIFLHLFI